MMHTLILCETWSMQSHKTGTLTSPNADAASAKNLFHSTCPLKLPTRTRSSNCSLGRARSSHFSSIALSATVFLGPSWKWNIWLVSSWILISCQLHRITWGEKRKENSMGKNNKQKQNKHQHQQQICYNDYKCIMANTSAMWQQAVHNLLAAQQEPYNNKKQKPVS